MPITVSRLGSLPFQEAEDGMDEQSQSEIVQRAIAVIDGGNTLEGLMMLEGAPSLWEIPVVSSYLAYCIAKERGQYREAIRVCQSALSIEPHNPAHYLNLGRIFRISNHKGDAFAAFQQGLSKDGVTVTSAFAESPADEQARQRTLIQTELRRMGIRKRAPFPFLPRGHPLNRVVGKALSKLKLR
jgi:tetratricopeptide (TPR) repeat protein